MSEKNTYSHLNAAPVLSEVNKLIEEYEAKKAEFNAMHRNYWHKPRMKGYRMDDVYARLSIFDWWTDTLSYSHLRDMRTFLREAIKLGFTGYVCFKVGASGCANGMWAHKKDSEDGFSPDGDFLYRSFTPDYTCWDFCVGGKMAYAHDDGDELSIRTIRQLEDRLFGIERRPQ